MGILRLMRPAPFVSALAIAAAPSSPGSVRSSPSVVIPEVLHHIVGGGRVVVSGWVWVVMGGGEWVGSCV